MKRNDIRNIAIIAHVDHGKTTLVDAMLRQSRIFRDNQQVIERVMDSNDLERERGITIMAKNTAVNYKGVKINILDTPGHADFGGEVERVMNMVDGVLLLVDAMDGPMPQTRFVLRKALQAGHRVIVVVNKIDRPNARPNHVVNETFDLFVDLGASDEQAEFATIYTSAITGIAGRSPLKMHDTLEPLFDAVIEKIPPPDVDVDAPSQLLVTTTSYDTFKGRMLIGRVSRGTLRKAQAVVHIARDGKQTNSKINQLFSFNGLDRVEVDEAVAGDIVALAGIDAHIGDTIADALLPEAMLATKIEEPTVRMTFSVNNSPFAGREGTHVTSRKIRDRLYAELERDVALRVEDTDSPEAFGVSGRGELHLTILIETMRREGYEFQVSRPEVIFKEDADGKKLEPIEQVEIEVSEQYQGTVIELMGQRRGIMRDMAYRDDGSVHLVFHVPTRGLLGFRQTFLTATRGEGLMNALFMGYEPLQGEINTRAYGSLVASEGGTTTTFGLHNAQERGQLFTLAGVDVYEGMVIGQHIREKDLEVNVCKKKHLTNMRSSGADDALRLETPRVLSLDDAIEYISDDELVEITPKGFRIRKKLLSPDERKRDQKRREVTMASAN